MMKYYNKVLLEKRTVEQLKEQLRKLNRDICDMAVLEQYKPLMREQFAELNAYTMSRGIDYDNNTLQELDRSVIDTLDKYVKDHDLSDDFAKSYNLHDLRAILNTRSKYYLKDDKQTEATHFDNGYSIGYMKGLQKARDIIGKNMEDLDLPF